VTTARPGTGTGRPAASGLAAPRVLLLVPARSYRAADFLTAAHRMGLDLVVGSDGALPLGGRPVIRVNPKAAEESAHRIMALGERFDAVVAADTPMLVLAAAVAARMGLPHNPVDAVIAATDKAGQRRRWAAARVAQPRFQVVPAGAPGESLRQAAAVGLPCVVKAVSLSASQGILRADDPAAIVAAAHRIRAILTAAGRPAGEPLLVEEYVPGPELSIDGLLTSEGLAVTAIFGKPQTPSGPTFEETMLITPAQQPAPVLAAAVDTAVRAARALGLRHGPIHAELRIDHRPAQARPVMLELAARSIGGLCSRALRFGDGVSLEELVLGNALGRPAPGHRTTRPTGVLMLPIPRSGVLQAVGGRADAAAVPGITGLTITVPTGHRVQALPEGDRYLGFIFAAGDTPGDVARALSAAQGKLRVTIQ
jgi:biotin carboxylase